jgi:hypothetical protein
MTDKLRELVERLKWLDDHAPNYSPGLMSSWIDSMRPELRKAAAALRELIEQKPVAVNDGNGLITPHGDPVPIGPLYASPVAQPSKEWLDEAMRLYDEGVQEACVPADNVKEHVDNFRAGLKARAALREHLEKR